MKKGKDLMLSIGGVIYGYASDCNFNITTDTTEVSRTKVKRSVSAGKFKEYESDVSGWDCNSNYVVTDSADDYETLVKAQLTGEPLDISFGDVTDAEDATSETKGATGSIVEATSGIRHSGKGIITSMQLSATVDGQSTYSVNIQGTGALDV